ncbi:MAG: DUF523 domain-containing protein [Candidatus Polarisedimenticolaceae bacterium]|nr:DUF523 domain-containing protein [Candidatus Polarisedimenticolaceae bacterium]
MASNKSKVGISGCLLGEKVRYDGTAKYQPLIVEILAARFELIPLCPEVGIGLSTPRPPIQCVMVDGHQRLLRVDDPSFDLTERMQQFARQSVEEISTFSGFIFKTRSPSCGLTGVKLFSENGHFLAYGEGAFARVVHKQLPKLPLVEESDLTNRQQIKAFAERVESYRGDSTAG